MSTRTYAFDVSPLFGARTGVGRYCEELLTALLAARRSDETFLLYALTARREIRRTTEPDALPTACAAPRVRLRRLTLPYRILDAAWWHLSWPTAETLLGDVDVVHGTAHRLPPIRRAAGVVTIHDLAPLHLPDHVSAGFRESFRRQVTAAVRHARAVVCPSESTRRDVVSLLGVPEERAHTIHLGVSQPFRTTAADTNADAAVQSRLRIAQPYVLFVGTSHPRKNLRGLLAAFRLLKTAHDVPHRLVVVGDNGADAALLRAAAREGDREGDVVFPGFVPDTALAALYRGAAALVLPSFHEGFGLPVVEAMACGCPVVTSYGSALEAVAGGAARLVSPSDPADIARGLAEVLSDPDLGARLGAAGRERARAFTWERAAAAHLALYRGIVG